MLGRKKRVRPLSAAPVVLPSGLCVKTEVGHWYINGNFRNRLGSKRILDSWSFPRIIQLPESSLANYKKGKKLGFRDGSLVRVISDGRLYFISQRKRCLITDPDLLSIMGLKYNDAVLVGEFEINLHEEGENL